MIGFMALASADATIRTDDELEDARWFTREEWRRACRGFRRRNRYRTGLIEEWYDAGSAVPLAARPGVKQWGPGSMIARRTRER